MQVFLLWLLLSGVASAQPLEITLTIPSAARQKALDCLTNYQAQTGNTVTKEGLAHELLRTSCVGINTQAAKNTARATVQTAEDTAGLDWCECNDGFLCAQELCDDGNVTDGDGCDSNCTATGCGNTIITTGEQCDDGNTDDGDGCSATCQTE